MVTVKICLFVLLVYLLHTHARRLNQRKSFHRLDSKTTPQSRSPSLSRERVTTSSSSRRLEPSRSLLQVQQKYNLKGERVNNWKWRRMGAARLDAFFPYFSRFLFLHLSFGAENEKASTRTQYNPMEQYVTLRWRVPRTGSSWTHAGGLQCSRKRTFPLSE